MQTFLAFVLGPHITLVDAILRSHQEHPRGLTFLVLRKGVYNPIGIVIADDPWIYRLNFVAKPSRSTMRALFTSRKRYYTQAVYHRLVCYRSLHSDSLKQL